MSKDELSLETRASAAYVQGRLEMFAWLAGDCPCHCGQEITNIVNEWKQAEAELKAQKVLQHTIDNELVRGTGYMLPHTTGDSE